MYLENKTPENCCACGACIDVCAHGAIRMKADDNGFLYPVIDDNKCKKCSCCESVCGFHAIENANCPEGFIAISNDKEVYLKSSSGGVFATIAKAFIERGGVVYGAAMVKENGTIVCRHIEVSSLDDLAKLQGSKYVRSQTEGVFIKIRKLLHDGKKVLFSGTSCQVAALKSFLGKKYDYLYTIDLVCHGTPEISLLQEYIRFLEEKYKLNIDDVSFRNKDNNDSANTHDNFVLTLKCSNKSGSYIEKKIHKNKSAYFKMFLSKAAYRPNCYSCPFASLNKSSDITLGDYKQTKQDVAQMGLATDLIYSTIIVHNEAGEELLCCYGENISKIPVAMEQLLPHHPNLRKPSSVSKEGSRMLTFYKIGGFKLLQGYVSVKGCKAVIMQKLKKNK